MLAVKSNKVKAFDLTPFSAFTRVKPNEQSFGLIVTADALPGDTWLTGLTGFQRFLLDVLLKKAVLGTLIMPRESVNLQGLKRHIVKRQTDKITNSSNGHSMLTPLAPQAATTDRCAAPYNHMKNNPVGVLPGRPLHKEEMAIHVAVNLSSAGLCCAMLYYVYDLALRTVLCHPHPML